MDQPQHQVFGTDNQSYRYTSYPFLKQPLQLLYPGRYMRRDYHYSGDNILHEDPIGLDITKSKDAALSRAYQRQEEALERHLGGKDKVVPHPAVEPEATIEDPALKDIGINPPNGPNPNLENVGIPGYDDLPIANQEDEQTVEKVRANSRSLPMVTLTKPKRYDWKDPILLKENFEHADSERTGSNIPNRQYSTTTWILIVVAAILTVVGISALAYGIRKGKHRGGIINVAYPKKK